MMPLFICTDLAQLLYLYFPEFEIDKKQLSSSFEVSLEGQQGPDVYLVGQKEISKNEKKTE